MAKTFPPSHHLLHALVHHPNSRYSLVSFLTAERQIKSCYVFLYV